MINIETSEYVNEGIAVRESVVLFFGIPIYKTKNTSTDRVLVEQLTPIKKRVKIKGFNNENKD